MSYRDSNPPWKDYRQQVHEQADARRVCSWCRRVVAEGSLPATHVLCNDCQATMDAELEAKYGVNSKGIGL